jgi:hypothetical protein
MRLERPDHTLTRLRERRCRPDGPGGDPVNRLCVRLDMPRYTAQRHPPMGPV